MTEPRVVLDARTRRRGSTLVGGSPLRVVRLGDRGVALLDAELAGTPSPDATTASALVRRLAAAGLVHPRPGPAPVGSDGVAVVIPVRDDAEGLRGLMDGGLLDGVGDVVVVDDGSGAPIDPGPRVRVVRHDSPRGPAASRNAGAAVVTGDIVAFVDADVTLAEGWLDELLRSFSDDAVVAVAPRIRASPGDTAIDRYEAECSPLDMGDHEAVVRPGSPTPYVPAAVLVVRRTAFDAVGGFDEGLRLGEDVDLVWRLAEIGDVRYRPDVEVTHRNRSTWPDVARQRASYASAAADLDRRHPGAAAPLVVNPWAGVAWALGLFGGRRGAVAGAMVAAGSVAALARRLRGSVDDPVPESLRLAGLGNVVAGRWILEACRRSWWPVLAAGAVVSRRMRRLAALVALGPPLVRWFRRRPALDPVTWTLARGLDDVAYGVGLWRGCLRRRSVGALLPRPVAGRRTR